MSTGLIKIIKQACMDSIHNSQLSDVRVGTVINIAPLKIQVSSQFIIPTSMLIIPEHLTDHTVKVTVEWETENESHKHAIEGEKTMTVHSGLKIGDKVALQRKTGGQVYYVLGRI